MDFTVFYEPLGTSHPLRGGAGRIILIEVILIEGRLIPGHLPSRAKGPGARTQHAGDPRRALQ